MIASDPRILESLNDLLVKILSIQAAETAEFMQAGEGRF